VAAVALSAVSPIRELLIASHILPWAKHPEYRLNLRNGLCLSRLHDAAFDAGLIAFDDKRRLLISRQLAERLSHRTVAENFGLTKANQCISLRMRCCQTRLSLLLIVPAVCAIAEDCLSQTCARLRIPTKP
jgi:hypothetical protein